MSAFARSPKQLGVLIQRHRKQRGLSQTELAGLAGLRQEMLSRLESGQPGTRLSAIYAVLSALDLEMTIQPRTKSSSDDIADLF